MGEGWGEGIVSLILMVTLNNIPETCGGLRGFLEKKLPTESAKRVQDCQESLLLAPLAEGSS